MSVSELGWFALIWFGIEASLLTLLILFLRWSAPDVGIRWPKIWQRMQVWIMFRIPACALSLCKPSRGHGRVFVWHRERFL